MNVLRAIENIRKDVLNFEEMFIESDMPDCFSRIYESENPTVSARELHEKLNIKEYILPDDPKEQDNTKSRQSISRIFYSKIIRSIKYFLNGKK